MKIQRVGFVFLIIGLLFGLPGRAGAQSSDQNLPTPILSSEVIGRIRPLDVVDPRLTRRFYAFEGTPGDLLLTVNALNLNGDLDVFTAVTFRPLMKITFYASSRPQPITKSVFLHGREILILRIEARTPNDDDGSYRIQFGGAFEPFSGGIPVAENAESQTDDSSGRSAAQLSSSGARIERPIAQPTPKVPEKTAEEASSNPTSPAKTAKSNPPKRVTPARRRGTRAARNKPPAPKEKPKTEAAKTDEAKTAEAKIEEAQPKTETTTPKVETPAPEKTTQEVTPPSGAHLIIEEKDGTKIDRPMATVRRVVVEGNTIVIVLKTGRIERIQMSNVLRMAIEPQ